MKKLLFLVFDSKGFLCKKQFFVGWELDVCFARLEGIVGVNFFLETPPFSLAEDVDNFVWLLLSGEYFL